MAQTNVPALSPVIIGKIGGTYGVGGGLKIYSYTRPREQIFSYRPWLLRVDGAWITMDVSMHRGRGRGLVAILEGVTGPEQARTLLGTEIAVRRQQLPDLPEGEYYWCDLTGMELIDTAGRALGTIIEMRETGANDIMVVRGQGEFLVPWVKGRVVKRVDSGAGRVYVDWDPEYQ